MAFKSKDLSVLSYANGFTLWHYRSEEDYITTLPENYFNDASHMTRVGDIIMCNFVDRTLDLVIVENKAGKVVWEEKG